jgi:hypothetical protein
MQWNASSVDQLFQQQNTQILAYYDGKCLYFLEIPTLNLNQQ